MAPTGDILGTFFHLDSPAPTGTAERFGFWRGVVPQKVEMQPAR